MWKSSLHQIFRIIKLTAVPFTRYRIMRFQKFWSQKLAGSCVIAHHTWRCCPGRKRTCDNNIARQLTRLISVSHRILQHHLYFCVPCTYMCHNNNIAQSHRILHSLYLCVTCLCYISICLLLKTSICNNHSANDFLKITLVTTILLPNSWPGWYQCQVSYWIL